MEAIPESPLLGQGGAESLDDTWPDVDAVLHKVRELDLAVWELVFQSKDQFFDTLKQVVEPCGDTWNARDEVHDAWVDLTDGVEYLRQDLFPPASS